MFYRNNYAALGDKPIRQDSQNCTHQNANLSDLLYAFKKFDEENPNYQLLLLYNLTNYLNTALKT